MISLLIGLLACTQAKTSGEYADFSLVVQGSGEVEFENDDGWNITLDDAYLAIGPLYLYDGEAMAKRWSLIRPAYACGAHAQFAYGNTLGELLEQYAVDLLSEPYEIGIINGIAGTIQSAELHLHPAGEVTAGNSSNFDKLEGESLYLAGIAEKEQDLVPFEILATIPDDGTSRIVSNIEGSVEINEKVILNIDLGEILSQVDFSTLTQNGNKYVLEEQSQAWTAIIMGLKSRYSYSIRGE